MNYSTHHQNYEPYPPPSQNMNTYNSQYTQPNMSQYPNYQFNPYHYYNNNNYPTMNQCAYFNQGAPINSDFNSNQTAKAKVTEKRESKPLIVIDPQKNEAIDFTKINKSKNSSLLNEIQPADNTPIVIPDLPIHTRACNNIEPLILKEVPQPLKVSAPQPEEIATNDIDELLNQKTLSPCIPLKHSYSIPNEMDNCFENNLIRHVSSSSETDLHKKSNASLDDSSDPSTNERKIYNRESLVEIGKSVRNMKPPSFLEDFQCPEIISKENNEITKSLDSKTPGIFNRKFNQRIINFGSPKSGFLSRITNGYLPPHLRIIEECSVNKHLEKCRRSLKSILNKIAPQNFKLCITEIKSIIKNTESVQIDDCIDCLIEEIFDKAVKEEAYSVTYANLCTMIANFDQEHNSKWNFKTMLLNRCKQMFETPLQDQLKSVKEHWERKIEEESDEKLKNLYRSDIDEQIKKARDKYFGNIRFIGELYMHDLLKPQIIHSCVQNLLPKTNDEDAMLSLCKLIETCGKKFDEQHKDKMKEIITQMTQIVDHSPLETRIRYRILDIIEMSDRKWLLRRIQAQKMIIPKTLEEVKNDDIEDKAILASKFSSSKSQHRASAMKTTSNSNDMRFNKINGTQTISVNPLTVPQSDNFNLKPSYGSWNAGSKDKDSEEWTNVDGKKSSKRNYNFTNVHGKPKHKLKPVEQQIDDSPRKKTTKGKYNALMDDEDAGDLPLPSVSPMRDQSPYEHKSEDDIPLIDRDALFDDFIQSKNLNVDAFCNQKDVSYLISCWLDKMMEKDKASRQLIGDIFARLVACGKLSKESLIDGLTQFLDIVPEIIADIPKIWFFLAEFLERFIPNEQCSGDLYKTIFQHLLPDTNVTKCLISIVEYAVERLGIDVIRSHIEGDYHCLVELILSQKDVLNEDQLNYFMSLLTAEIQEDKYSESFKSELKKSLGQHVELIYELLESKFQPDEMQTDRFVDLIANCLFSYICDLSEKSDVVDFIYEKRTFFNRLIDSKANFEAKILSSLCQFANHLEKTDLLCTVIENLSGMKLISDDAFQTFIHHNRNTSTDHNVTLMVDAITSIVIDNRR